MKVNEYKRIYHPRLGKIVFKNKRSGLIVDDIFKSMTQYEISSDQIIWPNTISELNNQKNKKLFQWWEYLVHQLNRFIQFWGISRFL